MKVSALFGGGCHVAAVCGAVRSGDGSTGTISMDGAGAMADGAGTDTDAAIDGCIVKPG